MTPPPWALSLAYWLHMIATVIWIGGLVTLAVMVLPAARGALDAEGYSNLIGNIQRRLDPLAWFSLVMLLGTGMVQMSANPNYQGFLAIDSTWAAAIFAKHLVFFGMAGLSAYLTWGVMPGLRRIALRRARGQAVPEAEKLQRQEALLLRSNLILGMIVLALTALARVAQ